MFFDQNSSSLLLIIFRQIIISNNGNIGALGLDALRLFRQRNGIRVCLRMIENEDRSQKQFHFVFQSCKCLLHEVRHTTE